MKVSFGLSISLVMITKVIPLSITLPVLGVAILWVTCICHPWNPWLSWFPTPPPLLCALSSSALLPLHPASPSAYPQPSICGLESLRPCQSPAQARLEDPQSPPPTSETQTTPPRAPPWLLARLGTIHHGLRLVLPSLWLWLRLHLGPLSPSVSPPAPRSPEPSAPPLALRIVCVTLAHRLSISALGSHTSGLASISQPPGVISPSSIGSSVGHLPGWALERLPSPPGSSLVPPSVCSSLVIFATCTSSVVILFPAIRQPPESPPACLCQPFAIPFRQPSADSCPFFLWSEVVSFGGGGWSYHVTV